MNGCYPQAFKRNLPFPAIEGGKDQEGACFSSVGNNLVLQDKNQDFLLFLVFTGQQRLLNQKTIPGVKTKNIIGILLNSVLNLGSWFLNQKTIEIKVQ
jgi:uncharacterized membrane protein (UPF0136 family)